MDDKLRHEKADDLDNPIECASPPCFMNEVAPEYLGYLNGSEIIDLLNLLLECESAGARGIMDISRKMTDSHARETLRDMAGDEARFCAMLAHHVKRLDGVPSTTTGAFYGKLTSLKALDAQMTLLDRGQNWVAEKLREVLPKISAEPLRSDLKRMLVVHERNIERARTLNAQPAEGG